MITRIQKYITVLLSTLVISINISLYAQSFSNLIQGSVADAITREELPNVNIFLSGTTWGTSSDLNGEFSLSLVAPGNYDLVFSMIGYYSETRKIIITDSSKMQFEIRLIPKVYQYKDIVIIEEIPMQWFEDLKLFKEKFLGIAPINIECEIKNEFHLDFSHPEENVLIAKCSVPLEIINYTLGYRILCEIENFEYDGSSNLLNYKYKLFFKEFESFSTDEVNDYTETRRRVYRNSLYYFLKTLISKELSETEFLLFLTNSIQRYSPSPGIELLSSKHIIEKNVSDDIYKLEFDGLLRVERYSNHHLVNMSWIKLNLPIVTIDKYGYPIEDFAFTLKGSWAKRGVATLLPKNYAIDADYYTEE